MEKLLSSEVKYEGCRFNVVQKIFEREDGQKVVRDIVNPGEASIILPITENNEVVFEKQLRESIGKVSLELPAGMIDLGEKPIQAAKRELEEETGLIANNIELMLSMYPSTGYTSEKVHIFLARDFKEGQVKFDNTEQILDIVKIPIEKCVEMAVNGELENASEIVAILLYATKFMK
jgi:ADP-ribose pyrophosphatase